MVGLTYRETPFLQNMSSQKYQVSGCGNELELHMLFFLDPIDGCFPKIVGKPPPKSSHFNNRVFHDFHHPFWGTVPTIFGNISRCNLLSLGGEAKLQDSRWVKSQANSFGDVLANVQLRLSPRFDNVLAPESMQNLDVRKDP